MRTGSKSKIISFALLLSVAVLCTGSFSPASAEATQTHRKAKAVKKPPLQPLPSGPTGPVQPIPLDSIAAVPPQVTYQDNQLTIVAPNSTLGDILRAIRKLTGAEIEIPSAPERVVTHLGPGPARSVVAELLNGSRFNYVLLGSPQDDTALTRIVLVAKSAPENVNSAAAANQPQITQSTSAPPQNPQEPAPDVNDAEAAPDDGSAATDDSADQAAAEADQEATSPDQPGVKTPQQMLQEMQQRQMQLQQQQQQPGQGPMPSTGVPPHPPQEQ
jgi:hypothetical protein